MVELQSVFSVLFPPFKDFSRNFQAKDNAEKWKNIADVHIVSFGLFYYLLTISVIKNNTNFSFFSSFIHRSLACLLIERGGAMGTGMWSVVILFCLSFCGHSQALTKHPVLSRIRRAPEAKEESRKCSYTFLVPEQKITGPICASRGYSNDKDRVTRLDVAAVRDLLSRQRREMETLKLVVDVDGNLVNEMKLMRKESRNMNSRVTQLYMQLLHEIIRKRDNSLELAQLETRILNATSESLRLGSRYRELEAKYAALSAVVNNQSVLIGALEERCMQVYSRRHDQPPLGPPLVQVVPENLPVTVPRFTNEIQRDNTRGFARERGSRSGPSPTSGTLEAQKPHQNFSSEGEGMSRWRAEGGVIHPSVLQLKLRLTERTQTRVEIKML